MPESAALDANNHETDYLHASGVWRTHRRCRRQVPQGYRDQLLFSVKPLTERGETSSSCGPNSATTLRSRPSFANGAMIAALRWRPLRGKHFRNGSAASGRQPPPDGILVATHSRHNSPNRANARPRRGRIYRAQSDQNPEARTFLQWRR
jgi:hypothetical protein